MHKSVNCSEGQRPVTRPSLVLSILPGLSSCFLEGTGSPYVTQSGLKLPILLPQLPEYWEYSYAPSCLVTLPPDPQT